MQTLTPEYHQGFSCGYNNIQCVHNPSADWQAGWLDGRLIKQEIEQRMADFDALPDECPKCGPELANS